MTRATHIWQRFLKVSLWLASIGLMIASSGLDGAYLSKLMPAGWAWLGLVLNTVADVVSELVMYWYGRLQMDASSAKRKRSRYLLVGQAMLVLYAWLFSWRQLVPILRQVDAEAATWLAPLSAAFIPTALIVVGYAQALLAGKIENVKESTPSATLATTDRQVLPTERPLASTLTAGVLDLAPTERREQVLTAMLADNPPTQAELADRFGVGRSTIGHDVAKLRQAGKLNGQREHA